MLEMAMLSSHILLFLLGNFMGFLLGFLPGFHPNLIKEIRILDPLSFSIFLISLGTAYNFSQAILACTAGYRNYGYIIAKRDLDELVKSGLIYSTLIAFLFPVFYLLKFSAILKPVIPSLLLIVSLHLIFKEKYKISAALIFISSGILGFLVLRFSLCKDPLLPLLSGLFGIPLMFREEENVFQNTNEKSRFISILLASLLMVSIPSLSPIQASIIISDLFKENLQALVGAVNFSQVISSIYSWFFIDKPREGYLEVLRNIRKNFLPLFILTFILSNILSYLLFRLMKGYFIKALESKRIKIVIIIFNIIMVSYFSGIFGILILLSSYLIGKECLERKISQVHCMGSLVIPTLFWYW